MPSEVATLRAGVEALESLCGEIYQVAGTVGAPVRVLDKLWAAAQGEAIPAASVLPLVETDFEEVAARQAIIDAIVKAIGPSVSAERARAGGAERSAAKGRAARANGKKGGRPRKNATAG